ncbi:hypothetical protein HML84_03850 [Alcanivorax sp. IO_7]|nr:hypothetical protein HML84_03850 [Alcanivorax sp. IO_7]
MGGCLKLFGGFQGLLARVDRYRLHCPFTTRLGLGPTPLAAWHLTDPHPWKACRRRPASRPGWRN